MKVNGKGLENETLSTCFLGGSVGKEFGDWSRGDGWCSGERVFTLFGVWQFWRWTEGDCNHNKITRMKTSTAFPLVFWCRVNI